MTHEITISGPSRAKVRSPGTVALLYVVTLGFYGIYWWYEINREMRDVGRARDASGLGDNPGLSAAAYFFGSCLLVPYIWTVVTTARRAERADELIGTRRRGTIHAAAVLLILAIAVGFPSLFLSGGAFVASLVAGVALEIAAIICLQSALNASWRGLARERETAPETGPAPEAA